MDDLTEDQIEELRRRVEDSCKDHDWVVLSEEDGVSECSICHSTLFWGPNTLEIFMKYLLE